MKVAFSLDGLLTDKESLYKEWFRRYGDNSFLKDEAFWAALQPYDDVAEFGDAIKGKGWELYLFVERPRSFMLVSRNWVRRASGLTFPKEQVVMQALKRYDCRMLGIDAYIDSSLGDLNNLKIETVVPVDTYHVDREAGESLPEIVERIVER